ncbi:hypothetical protein ABIE41_003460 [Bosea sp. OAE506]|uniref:hypothetical protein n=1 Tax=Bosea sp. OAE506 TaxID=2663870 RepID=UPI001789231E
MTSAIYAWLVADLKIKQDDERRLLIRQKEARDLLRREITAVAKLLVDIRSGRLDESAARMRREDVVVRLTALEQRLARLKETMLGEAGKPRKPTEPVGPRKPLTPAQATKVAQRDEKRRDRVDDLVAAKREQVVKRD